MTGVSGKLAELLSRGTCGRRLQGTNWEQVWMVGQTSPRCSNMTTSSWRKGACVRPEACCWPWLRRRAGRRSCGIEDRRCARDARKRTRTCIIEFGKTHATHVISLTRQRNSFKKATQAQNTLECFWLRGLVPRSWTLQDTKLGFWRQYGNGVLTEEFTYIFGNGSGTHSDPRIRRVECAAAIIQGMSNCLGQTLECWKRHSERLMNSLKPTGGWVGTLGEGEPNTVGRAELMACVVAAESTRGNVENITDYEIVKKRQDRGRPTPRLGLGSNPDLLWRMSRALKSRQGIFTVQWQRAHVAAAGIKQENHDMTLVFGYEMADAVAKRAE